MARFRAKFVLQIFTLNRICLVPLQVAPLTAEECLVEKISDNMRKGTSINKLSVLTGRLK